MVFWWVVLLCGVEGCGGGVVGGVVWDGRVCGLVF